MRWTRFVLAAALFAGACTQPATDDETPTPSVGTTGSQSVVTTGARMPDGTPLPPGCTGGAGASHTVAFVAEGRAWALDPDEGDLACLFPVEDAGPFAWGPQGDRVLLNRFEIRGVGGDAPDLPAIDTSLRAFDWGHPLGLAVVFADAKGIPGKRFVDDGRLIRLVSLPPGTYLQVAYHPSGLALAFVVETIEGQEIWLSTNEGTDPQRLIFSERGTEFTSLAFSPNGRTLWWTAQHEEGYPELHFMKLESRTGFGTAWRGTEGSVSGGLRLAPSGTLQAVTESKACEERMALVLSRGETRTAMPGETRPTEALGWLDRTTLLVAAGGCGEAMDLFAVDGLGLDAPAALVLDVEIAAPRTQVANPPREVPAPSPDEEPPPEGVG
ncbi:MAG: TolB family protein [Actinomycetota bacterium]